VALCKLVRFARYMRFLEERAGTLLSPAILRLSSIMGLIVFFWRKWGRAYPSTMHVHGGTADM
jgi:hypothetical protein